MKPTGERLPYTALVIGAAMLGAYVVNILPQPPVATADILRSGPAPRAPWKKPTVEDLLAGRACLPLRYLLENREIEPVHSYSRDVACKEGPQ